LKNLISEKGAKPLFFALIHPNMSFTYPKNERLCSKILIDKIFESGKKFYNPLFKVLCLPVQLHENVPVQSLISISKRRFKRANKRNLLKRRIKDVFRQNKNELYLVTENLNIQIAVVIIYNSNDLHDYSTIEKNLLNVLESLKNYLLSGKLRINS
jgi:ribonuclease P protein component